MPLCALIVGIILATPEDFSIAFVEVKYVPPITGAEALSSFVDLWDLEPVVGSADVVTDIGRPRCLEPTEDGG